MRVSSLAAALFFPRRFHHRLVLKCLVTRTSPLQFGSTLYVMNPDVIRGLELEAVVSLDLLADVMGKDYFASHSMNQTVSLVRDKLDKIQSSGENIQAGSASKKQRVDNRRRV
ncbi:hypothetical protein GmHk_11G031774 [Glycine max]|nr:hypothetical protein GmHk_11G031774 [Glycine max]